jgi:tetratricopeptide (TPR) repeat protein
MLPELRVEIRKLGNQFFASTKRTNGQEICSNEFRHDPTGLTHLGPLWLLERGTLGPDEMQRLGIQLGSTVHEGQVAMYGRRLYGYLFGKGREFRNFLKAHPDYRRARLTLSLHADADALWRLPWEYMHDGEQFVCLEGNMLLGRLPEALDEVQPTPHALPLRVLFVISTPEDQEALDVERELAVTQDALDELIHTGRVQMDVLDEPTLRALGDALRAQAYHVVHYIGHGTYSSKQQRGFLCFEDAIGETDRVGALHLEPLLNEAPSLRMMVISACQSAQIGVLAAFDHVASGLLHAGLPAVLSIPTSLRDESTIALAQALYAGLSDGEPVVEAVHAARLALKATDDERPEDQRRFDWGVPALYLRAQALAMIDPDRDRVDDDVPAWSRETVQGLPLPRVFVDRRKALHALRRAAHRGGRAMYVLGGHGVGKSALVAKLAQRASIPPRDVLLIHCRELLEPVTALEHIADFWREHPSAAYREAAALLLDTRRDPAGRAREALQRLAEHRQLLIFDDLDAWFEMADTLGVPGQVADETMRAVFSGFLAARAAATYVFTGQRRWAGLAREEDDHEIQLLALSPRDAVVLMSGMPRLRAMPLSLKLRLNRCVGGYPQTLRLLNAWLSDARAPSPSAFLDDPPLEDASPEAWARHFLDEILDRLDPGEYEALTAITVLKRPFCAEAVPKITRVTLKYAQTLLERWHEMALVQFHHREGAQPWYTFHPLTREYILARLSSDMRTILHTRAAVYYGAPFLDEARRRVVQNISDWPEERIAWLARDGNGVLGMWVRQTQNLEHARQSMDHALAWQYHLFRSQQPKAATQVVRAVVPVLNRWGQRDLSKVLLQHSVSASQGDDRTESLNDLARQHIEVGHLRAALNVYEEVYQALEAQGARHQMAHILTRIGSVHYRVGQYDWAAEKYEHALQLMREVGDVAGQATCLHQLTRIHRRKGLYKQALAYSQSARELDVQRGDRAGLARSLYEQGAIFKALERADSALERFRQSLEIARDIGDETYVVANLQELADVLQGQGRVDDAIAHLLEALEVCQRVDKRRAVGILNALGALYDRQNKRAEAAQMRSLAQRLAE